MKWIGCSSFEFKDLSLCEIYYFSNFGTYHDHSEISTKNQLSTHCFLTDLGIKAGFLMKSFSSVGCSWTII